MKNMSRRKAATVLPAILAAAAQADAAERLPPLLMNAGETNQRESKTTRQRMYFDGLTHENIRVEMHETVLFPGQMPHAAHRHAHEELILLREGAVEVEMEGEENKVVRAGGIIFVASNRLHGWKNAGDTDASYFVVRIGG